MTKSLTFSEFGQRFTAGPGILSLMDDLGQAMAGGREMCMLGGGNPSHIPEVQQRFRERMQEILGTPGEFERLIGNYDAPSGNERFIEALAELFRREFGWPVHHENIALTPGSQSGFFVLFNLLAGRFADGRQRRILLPMAPEYIGYSDLGLSPGVFTARRPIIDRIGDHRFKYRIDFDALASAEDVGVICVSRPTNPTGNVLTDAEMRTLLQVAQTRDVPLIVDSAYGAPFPNIMFVPATPMFDDHTILCMSLSKLGLPGARTGIVVAAPKLIKAIASVNAIINLASGGFGPALAQRFVESGEITALGRNVIGPYYRERSQQALAWLDAALAGVDYRIHQPEGAIFLWLWFPGLPITSAELYERLKQRGVLVVSGHYFFPGLDEDWAHRHECIRVTYSQSPADVQRGIACIAEEVRRAFSSRRS